jgi:hypothetical protein
MSRKIVELFVSRLRGNFEAWNQHEIDFPTLNEHQSATWKIIGAMGPEVEAAVVRELSTGAALAKAAQLNGNHRRTEHSWSTPPARTSLQSQGYRARIERTVMGSPVLKIFAVDEREAPSHRQTAALLYELAANMERLSQVLEAHWCISPDPHNDRIVVEIVSDDDIGLANILFAEIMLLHQLT